MRQQTMRPLLLALTLAATACVAWAAVSGMVGLGIVPHDVRAVLAWALYWCTLVGLLLATQLTAAASWLLLRRAGQLGRCEAEQTKVTEAVKPKRSMARLHAKLKELETAVAERKWQQAEAMLAALEDEEADEQTLQQARSMVRSHRDAHVRELTEQLEAAKREANPQGVLDLRDRLVPLLEVSERHRLDESLARWSLTYLREALHEGRARELIDLIERMVETFGESTTEGIELKNALPILRRSAGRCPDCGRPYDISLERCAECEQKRRTRRRAIGAKEAAADDAAAEGNGQQSGS